MTKIGFKQSRKHKKKINTVERAKKISKTLKLKYKLGLIKSWNKGKKLDANHILKIKKSSKRGSKNHSWKGSGVGYASLHMWLRKYFGDAIKCDNKEKKILNFSCSGVTKSFQWARKKEHKYTRNKRDYFQLCRSCHSKYDYKPKNRICDVENCNQKHKRYGFCEKHSQRFKKWGNPLAVKTHHKSIKYIL